jgi:hypothetical protein
MRSFPDEPLVETLERVAREDPGSRFPHFWREVQSHLAEPRIRNAIDGLLNSPPATARKRGWKQRLKRLLRRD